MAALPERVDDDRDLVAAGPAAPWRPDVVVTAVVGGIVALFPIAFAVVTSFQSSSMTGFRWGFSLDAWRSVFGSGRFAVVIETLGYAALVAAIATLVSIPAAYVLRRARPVTRAIVLAFMTAPFFVDLTSRMFALRVGFSRDGAVEMLLSPLGIEPGVVSGLLFGPAGVVFGMPSAYLCTAFFPVFIGMSLIPAGVLDAARTLGGGDRRGLARVVIPLAAPAIVAGFVLSFLCCLGDFVIARTITGEMVPVIGTSIESAVTAFRFPVVGALTTILFGVMLVIGGLARAVLSARRSFGRRQPA